MLTRLHVKGFKNLLDLEVYFGPFTSIAGLNGVGKSNLFDAVRFLHLLTRHPIVASSVDASPSGKLEGEKYVGPPAHLPGPNRTVPARTSG